MNSNYCYRSCIRVLSQSSLLAAALINLHSFIVIEMYRCGRVQVCGVAAVGGRMSTSMSEYSEDAARPTSRPSRPTGRQLSHQDARAVRVWEASVGRRLGRRVSGWSCQRSPATAHLVLAEPALSALLPARTGLAARPVGQRVGRCRQARLANTARTTHQLTLSGQTLTKMRTMDAWASVWHFAILRSTIIRLESRPLIWLNLCR